MFKANITSAVSSNGVLTNGYAVSLAFDGIFGNNMHPFMCYHSDFGSAAVSPALTLDLGHNVHVLSVVLWPREDCCPIRNLYWVVAVGDNAASMQNCTVPVDVTPSPSAGSIGSGPTYAPFNTSVPCGLDGRYVIISRPYRAIDENANNFLQICEVIIIAQPYTQTPSASGTPTQTGSSSTTPTLTATTTGGTDAVAGSHTYLERHGERVPDGISKQHRQRDSLTCRNVESDAVNVDDTL